MYMDQPSATEKLPLTGEMSIFDRLEEVASRMGPKRALIDSDSTVIYDELLMRCLVFVKQLGDVGVRSLDRVGVILGNSSEFLVAAFAVWKCGATLVPLNPLLKEAELLKYVLDCSVRVMVTVASKESLVRELRRKGAPIEHLWLCSAEAGNCEHRWLGHTSDTAGKALDETELRIDRPAITQYSTGSTGYPKRVTRSQKMLLGEYLSVSGVLNVTGDERIVGIAPFFHSYGLMNAAVLALLSGGTLYMANTFSAKETARLIERERITIFPGVPFMYKLLAELREHRDFSSLRFALCGGVPLPEETARAFEEAYGVAITQVYGTTETGVVSIQRPSTARLSDSVGKPIPGVSVKIMTDTGDDAAIGIAGNVQISSGFGAVCYDNSNVTSENHFSKDGFIPGDIGQLSANGELKLCGRSRGFINVSGSKVDPAEVEAVLLDLQEISEVVVVGIDDGAAGQKVKAVVISQEGISQERIRAHCAHHLAEFKHPKVIEFRSELPRSPLGKILRKYLLDEASGD